MFPSATLLAVLLKTWCYQQETPIFDTSVTTTQSIALSSLHFCTTEMNTLPHESRIIVRLELPEEILQLIQAKGLHQHSHRFKVKTTSIKDKKKLRVTAKTIKHINASTISEDYITKPAVFSKFTANNPPKENDHAWIECQDGYIKVTLGHTSGAWIYTSWQFGKHDYEVPVTLFGCFRDVAPIAGKDAPNMPSSPPMTQSSDF